MSRSTTVALLLLALAGCETTNSDDWTGGAGTPFKQAEKSCESMLADIANDEDRREFFIGCMNALGWKPKPGASVAL